MANNNWLMALFNKGYDSAIKVKKSEFVINNYMNKAQDNTWICEVYMATFYNHYSIYV